MQVTFKDIYIRSSKKKEKTDDYPERTTVVVQDKSKKYALSLNGDHTAKIQAGMMVKEITLDVDPMVTKYGLMFRQI